MDYTRYKATAERLLKKFGSAVSITRYATETYNAATNTYTKSNPTLISGMGVLSSCDEGKEGGEAVRSGDLRLVCTLSSAPAVGDEVVFAGVSREAVGVSRFSPDGSAVIYYELHLREGA